MPSIEFRTIGDFMRGKMALTAYCRARDCHHSKRLNLPMIANRLGEDFDLYGNGRIDLRVRCAECGEKGATFIISPP